MIAVGLKRTDMQEQIDLGGREPGSGGHGSELAG
jgi:hypothetical protein